MFLLVGPTPLRRPLLAIAVASAAFIFAACGGNDEGDVASASNSDALVVVATTTILGDIAENIVGEAGTVSTLMSPGQDPHSFDLSASAAAALRDADLVIANGLGLEAGFDDVLEDARDSGTRVLFVADQVDPLPFAGPGNHGDEGESDGHRDEGEGDDGSLDPHFWMDPLRVATAARLIGAELEKTTGAGDYGERAEAYAVSAEALEREIATILEEVPADSRKLVTNHDSLGYLADRYGFEIVGVVIPGGSTFAEPSAREIVDLVETIQHENVPALFSETSAPATLAEVVADETGRDVKIVVLFTGSVGEEGSGAETYERMMRTNAERISAALLP